MFYGSMSEMVKTALRHELRANAVNDEKFEDNKKLDLDGYK
jgi:hypothetical protein